MKRCFPLPFRRALSVVAALLFMLAASGCLHLRETVTLRPDGSMTVSLVYAVPETRLPALSAAHHAITDWQQRDANTAAPRVNWFLDEAAVRAYYTRPEHGIRVMVYNRFRKDGRECAEIVVEASNARRAFENGYFGDVSLDGRRLTFPLREMPGDLPAEDIRRLRESCEDLTIELAVRTPSPITETNGFRRDKKQAVWIYTANGDGIDLFGKLTPPSVSW